MPARSSDPCAGARGQPRLLASLRTRDGRSGLAVAPHGHGALAVVDDFGVAHPSAWTCRPVVEVARRGSGLGADPSPRPSGRGTARSAHEHRGPNSAAGQRCPRKGLGAAASRRRLGSFPTAGSAGRHRRIPERVPAGRARERRARHEPGRTGRRADPIAPGGGPGRFSPWRRAANLRGQPVGESCSPPTASSRWNRERPGLTPPFQRLR
jgi:hypothetical protein